MFPNCPQRVGSFVLSFKAKHQKIMQKVTSNPFTFTEAISLFVNYETHLKLTTSRKSFQSAEKRTDVAQGQIRCFAADSALDSERNVERRR